VLLAKTEDGGMGEYPEADFDRAVALLEQASADAEINVAKAGARSLAVVTGDPLREIVQPAALPPGFDVDLVLSLETASTRPTARIRTNRGDIVVTLANELAPATVANFITLARDGFYNGLMFHRVVADFVIQTGDPRGDGWGGPGYAIRCEYTPAPYTTGAMGMAHAGRDTGGSQFFFTHSPQPHLEGRYTLFGNIIEGQDVADLIQVGDSIQEVVLEGL
jgi:cyclophilin family peptidyl-prolyl cis-trans isomerase